MDSNEKPVITNAASGKQLRAARKTIRQRKRQEKTDLLFVLDSPEGRRLIWRYLSFCGVNETPFAENANLMAFKCGMQNVGQRILADLVKNSPDAYLLMMQEHKEAE